MPKLAPPTSRRRHRRRRLFFVVHCRLLGRRGSSTWFSSLSTRSSNFLLSGQTSIQTTIFLLQMFHGYLNVLLLYK